ncbi:hypothetical protein SNE40_007115 [Patella caerulea]|uniref:G-protein coupled receptors family 1 profile domain-containing protein n=1 Tax=Patella caerulea TaxID=87958 RepID=A0AAN8JX20_PATCE
MAVNSTSLETNCSDETANLGTSLTLELRICIYTLLIIVCVFSIIGNVITISAISLWKPCIVINSNRKTFIFVRSLCVADILVGAVAVPLKLYVDMVTKVRENNEILCLIGESLDMMACTSSIYHLLMMSGDRYLAICRPLVHRTLPRHIVYIALAVSWIVPCLISFPPVLSKLHLENQGPSCTAFSFGCYKQHYNATFITIGSLITFYAPSFVICIFYYKIFAVVRQRRLKDPIGGSIVCSETAAAKTISVILSSYFVCWLPFFILYVLSAWVDVPLNLLVSVEMLGYINSMLNPILYYRCNRSVKTAINQLTNRCLKRDIKERTATHITELVAWT